MGSLLTLLLLRPAAARAQFAEPEVRVERLSSKDWPPVAEDEAAVLAAEEFYGMKSRASAAEELAVIRVVFKGKWFRSADYLARERAAGLGANALLLTESAGREDWGDGAVRVYKVYRLADSSGRALYPNPPEDLRQASAAEPVPAPSLAPTAEPSGAASPEAGGRHRHFAWVWREDGGFLSHRLGFDVSRASREEFAQLNLYVRENFPAGESRKLDATCRKRGGRIVLDFTARTVACG